MGGLWTFGCNGMIESYGGMSMDAVVSQETYLSAMRERLTNYHVNERGCHIWGGYIDRNGYGRVYDPARGRLHWVHIVAHEIYKGPVPTGHEIDHTCVTPPCMRPECLDAVTKAEHAARTYRRLGKDDLHLVVAEMRRTKLTYAEIGEVMNLSSRGAARQMVQAVIRKGIVSAQDVPPAKRLTASERDDIRDLFTLGVPQTVLAECYGVDSSHVSRVCSGQIGGHQ